MIHLTIPGQTYELCLLDDVSFIPINYCILDTEEEGKTISLLYKKSTIKEPYHRSNTARNLSQGFKGLVSSIMIQGKVFFLEGGQIRDEKDNLLVCVTIKKECYTGFEMPVADNYHKFIIFYSSELLLLPSYAHLHRRIIKTLITPYLEKGMEMRILSSSQIENNTFVRIPVIKKALSLNKMYQHMQETLPTLLYSSSAAEELEDDFFPQCENIVISRNVEFVQEHLMPSDYIPPVLATSRISTTSPLIPIINEVTEEIRREDQRISDITDEIIREAQQFSEEEEIPEEGNWILQAEQEVDNIQQGRAQSILTRARSRRSPLPSIDLIDDTVELIDDTGPFLT